MVSPGGAIIDAAHRLYRVMYNQEPPPTRTTAFWLNWFAGLRGTSAWTQVLRGTQAVNDPWGAVWLQLVTSGKTLAVREQEIPAASEPEPPMMGIMRPQIPAHQWYALVALFMGWAARQVAAGRLGIRYLDAVIETMVWQGQLPKFQTPTENPTQLQTIVWGSFLRDTGYSDAWKKVMQYSLSAWREANAEFEANDRMLGAVSKTLSWVSLQEPARKAAELLDTFFDKREQGLQMQREIDKLVKTSPELLSPGQRQVYENARRDFNGISDEVFRATDPLGAWQGPEPAQLGVPVVLMVKLGVAVVIVGLVTYAVHRITSPFIIFQETQKAAAEAKVVQLQQRQAALDAEFQAKQAAIVASQTLTDEQKRVKLAETHDWYQNEGGQISDEHQQVIDGLKVPTAGMGGVGLMVAAGAAAVALIMHGGKN